MAAASFLRATNLFSLTSSAQRFADASAARQHSYRHPPLERQPQHPDPLFAAPSALVVRLTSRECPEYVEAETRPTVAVHRLRGHVDPNS